MEKIGYFCTFTPKEIIYAGGFLPVRMLANNQPISLANTHLQSYCCSQVRGCLERLLSGEIEVYGVVFTRSCDSLMRLADIWEKNSKMKVYNIEFPTKINSKSKKYLINEFWEFKNVIESWSGRDITLTSLLKSIELYEEIESLLRKLFELRPDYEMVLKAETEAPERIIRMLRGMSREGKFNSGKQGKKVLVTGSICVVPEIMNIIESSGFLIVDDLCTGTRFFTSDIIREDAPLNSQLNSLDEAVEYLAEKYLLKTPCPTKHYDNDRRFNYVLNRAKDVDAVIFLLMKFCEPYFFDYPQLRDELEKMGKRTLLIEIEHPVSVEQIRTRIEAFAETL